MNIARRTKKTAEVAGLLAVLSLAIAGCQAGASPEPPADTAKASASTATPVTAPSAPFADHQNKVVNFEPAKAKIDKTYTEAFGGDFKLAEAVAKDGISILSVMYGEHPEHTVYGFVPTEDIWKAAKAEMAPHLNVTALAFIEKDWTTKRDIPMLTSYRSGDGKNQTYRFTTDAGEKCTDSDQPYDVELANIGLKASDTLEHVTAPWFTSELKVTVPCKEGGKLQGVLGTSFLMAKQGDKWLMAYGYEISKLKPFEMVK